MLGSFTTQSMLGVQLPKELSVYIYGQSVILHTLPLNYVIKIVNLYVCKLNVLL